MDEVDDQQKRPVVERERFSGTDRSPSRRQNETADRPPISSEEMQRGRTELAQHPGSRVNWRVFLIASIVIVAFSLWAILLPDTAQTTMKTAVDWIAENLGWYYVLTITIVIPSSARSCITFSTSWRSSGSRAEVGSSNSIIFGFTASARAIATRCC